MSTILARSALCTAALLMLGEIGCRCSERDAARTKASDEASDEAPTREQDAAVGEAPAEVSEDSLLEALGTPLRLAAGDVDGDGSLELVAADQAWLRVAETSGAERARLAVPGGIQVLRAADVDDDGRAEILAGWGRSRDHQKAPARVSLYRLSGDALAEATVARPRTSRNEVVEILPMPAGTPRLLLAHFESKYMVRIATARRGGEGWELSPLETIRMATSFALGDVDGDGETDVIVGRVYGDDTDAKGDAFVLRPDGTRVPIPITGGVRSLVLADLGGDGRLDILIGDGWDQNYGRKARAQLTRAWWSEGEFRSELLDESPDEFTFWELLAADLDGDDALEIVTRGNERIRVLARKGERWRGRTVGPRCYDAALAELDETAGAELLLACPEGVQIERGGIRPR